MSLYAQTCVRGLGRDRPVPVSESYLADLEPTPEISDKTLRAALAEALPDHAPTAKMVALCNLVALL